MKAFIEDRNGTRYNFRRLTRSETTKIISSTANKKLENYELAEEQFKQIFKICNPNYNMDLFESEILSYNHDEIGYINLITLMNMVIDEAFHTTGTNPNKYSFLAKTQE